MQRKSSLESPVLAVDDDQNDLEIISNYLTLASMPTPVLISDSRQVMAAMRRHKFMVVILDLLMPHLDGINLLHQIKQEFPYVECIMLSGQDDLPAVVSAIRSGAFDYLVKSKDLDRLTHVVKHALERQRMRQRMAVYSEVMSLEDLANPEAFSEIVAVDEANAKILRLVEIVAPTDYNVILNGESGTGKEMLARIIHKLSLRESGSFVAVNMAAISPDLFEAIFFGHTRGAFTGAMVENGGFFEAARGGTLFLDEISELRPDLQGKLLRVIQEGEYYPVGSSKVRVDNCRLIVASNRNLKQAMQEGSLRKDLYYRLNEVQINIPPLRDRKDDILPLANHFLGLHAAKIGKKIDSIAEDLARALTSYDFPGNVRELKNLIATGVLVENSDRLRLSSLPEFSVNLSKRPRSNDNGCELLPLSEVERRHVEKVLEACGGNRTVTAKVLGIGLSTLQRRLKVYEIDESSQFD